MYSCIHSMTTEMVIGGDESISIDIMVANDGEDAFEAKFFAVFPLGLQFVRVERKSSVSTWEREMCRRGGHINRYHGIPY